MAKVTPVFKSGGPSDIEVFESVLYDRIGFMVGTSTVTNLDYSSYSCRGS